MPSGDITPGSPRWQMNRYFTGEEKQRSPESEACYRKEWREIIDCLRPFVSIGVWVPFNETWGQFKTPEIAAWTKAYDPTRLVNAASGESAAALPQRSGVRTICFSKKPACMAAHASCLCLPVLYHVGFLFASLGIL